jgi:hypothetical protein
MPGWTDWLSRITGNDEINRAREEAQRVRNEALERQREMEERRRVTLAPLNWEAAGTYFNYTRVDTEALNRAMDEQQRYIREYEQLTQQMRIPERFVEEYFTGGMLNFIVDKVAIPTPKVKKIKRNLPDWF